MLQAVDSAGVLVQAWRAVGSDFRCPACGEVVILKRGVIVVEHFAHKAWLGCQWGEGESQRHLAMKRQMLELVTPELELEVADVAPGRRADLFGREANVALECQASGIGLEEWRAREQAYREAGVPLVWVWDEGLLFGRRKGDEDYRLGAAVVEDSDRSGSVYVLTAVGVLFEVVLVGVEPRSRLVRGERLVWQPRMIFHLRSSRLREPLVLQEGMILEQQRRHRLGAISGGPYADGLFQRPTERGA